MPMTGKSARRLDKRCGIRWLEGKGCVPAREPENVNIRRPDRRRTRESQVCPRVRGGRRWGACDRARRLGPLLLRLGTGHGTPSVHRCEGARGVFRCALGRAPAHDVLRAREIVWAVHGRGPGDIHGRNLPRVTPSGWNAARRASIRIRIYGTAPRQTPTRSTTHAVSPSFQPEHGGPRRQSEPCKRRTQVARPQSGSSTMAGQPNRS